MTTGTIRFRITAVAGIVVAAVLVVAGVALVLLQRSALVSNLDQTLARRADDLVALVSTGDPPENLAAGADEGFAQLVGADGSVIASTRNLNGLPAIAIDYRQQGDTIQRLSVSEADDDAFRVLSRPLEGGVLHVGASLDVVSESTTALIGSLALTIPAVIVVLVTLVWWLVGRTLRPVEAIRSEVAEIESTDLHRRVPRPGTEDEIDRLAVTMNEMLGRLETSVDRQRLFVADASHELRSPMTRLRTELELEIGESSDQLEQRRLRSLLEEVLDMQAMVEDLLYLARSDEGKVMSRVVRLDLDDLVLTEAHRIAGDETLTVDIQAVSGAHVEGDRAQLGRAVRNLLDNARRHAASTVSIALEETEQWAVLNVRDDGPGVPEAGADLIFERFGRMDEARSATSGGTGLGLAIAREIVERHGGSLVLTNPGEPGAGFEMKIPTAS